MKLTQVGGDVDWLTYGGTWATKALHNGDWRYWLIVQFTNVLEDTGELWDGDRYHVGVYASSPEAAGPEAVQMAADALDIDTDDLDERTTAVALFEYGINSGTLWEDQGNNAHTLMREARRQLPMLDGLFGFFMDAPKNRLGASGWDMIAGDPLAPLHA